MTHVFLQGKIKEMQNLDSCLYQFSCLRNYVVICKVEMPKTHTSESYIEMQMKLFM